MNGYPWRPLALSVALWGVAAWLYEIDSGWWAFVLGWSAAAYGQWRYRCGQRSVTLDRPTCMDSPAGDKSQPGEPSQAMT